MTTDETLAAIRAELREICAALGQHSPHVARPRLNFTDQQRAEMVDMYRSGMTLAQVAARFEVSTFSIQKKLREIGEPRRAKGPAPTAHIDLMADLYREGQTLQTIGDKFNLSGERVRQLLRKAGVASDAGGSRARLLWDLPAVVRAKRQKQDARAFRKWGLSYEDYTSHIAEYGSSGVRVSPLHRFLEQRRSSKQRGIVWEITFKDWWFIWRESGHWPERGRGRGYGMARLGDSGPYKVGNVEIITGAQNASDSYLVKPGRERWLKGRETMAARVAANSQSA